MSGSIELYDDSPEIIEVEGYKFKEWTYNDRCEIEDLATVSYNRYIKPSQWENEVYRILFVKHCVSWPCSLWENPVECTEEAKTFLYKVQTKLCRKLILRVMAKIDTINSDRLKNWQTGPNSGGSTQ